MKQGALAEVLAARAAVAALAAGPAQPRDPDPVAGREALRPLPRLDHLADDLVAEDQRQLRLGELAVDDVQVGAADAAGDHPDESLPGPGLGIGQLGPASGRLGSSSTIARTTESSRERTFARIGRGDEILAADEAKAR